MAVAVSSGLRSHVLPWPRRLVHSRLGGEKREGRPSTVLYVRGQAAWSSPRGDHSGRRGCIAKNRLLRRGPHPQSRLRLVPPRSLPGLRQEGRPKRLPGLPPGETPVVVRCLIRAARSVPRAIVSTESPSGPSSESPMTRLEQRPSPRATRSPMDPMISGRCSRGLGSCQVTTSLALSVPTQLPSDKIPGPYKNEEEARAANNGAYPPDLSLYSTNAVSYSLLTHSESSRPVTTASITSSLCSQVTSTLPQERPCFPDSTITPTFLEEPLRWRSSSPMDRWTTKMAPRPRNVILRH